MLATAVAAAASLLVAATTAATAAGVAVVLGVAAAATTTATRAAGGADELEVVDDNGQLGALPAAVLVFPLVVLEPALDEDGLALAHVLVEHLGPTRLHLLVG